MIFGKYSEILEEKETIAQNKLKKAKPVIATSLKEGILILAANPDLKFNKIYPLYDRIACVISGARTNFKPIFRMLRFRVENWANYYSEGDIVLEDLAEEFAGLLKDRFENPELVAYTVNVAFIEIAPTQKDDILIRIDFKGDLKDFNSHLVLASDSEVSDLEQKTKNFLSENYPIEKIFSEIAAMDKELHRTNAGRLEAVFLNREKVIKKEFEEVFQRLDLKNLISRENK